jgi:hypothetical protein
MNLLKSVEGGRYITGTPPIATPVGPPPGISEQVPALNTKLNLNITSTNTFQVDGRTLATIIKNYMGEELLRSTAATGSSTKDFVI